MMDEHIVGIDVSKTWLDVHILPQGQACRLPNTEDGCRQLARELLALNPVLVALEATGGYEQAGVLALGEAGVPVSVVNPERVRD